ncbi:MAG: hypothetical protein KC418_21535 [Anaerolineales bacterium]|nr:hypothetical protein [Anaerolineales bacterium]MCB8953659.1 hypothetical protein [Ardenticatenales bacterium]
MNREKCRHFLLLAVLLLLALPPRLWAQSENRAALVVRYADGQVDTRCVSFSESQITGHDLLVRAGMDLTIEAGGIGAAVCAINGVGCPATDCFCQCQGAECVYWSYWHQIGGSWQYSQGGAGIYPITDGAVDGWSWGPGSVTAAIPPPDITFADVCSAPPASPTVAPTATATPAPPTVTPVPATATPEPLVDFGVEADIVAAGSCTVLHWDAEHVSALYLDGAGVEGHGARQVCPAQDQTYTLRATHGGGEIVRQVTVAVRQPSPTTTVMPTDTVMVTQSAAPPAPQPTATPPIPSPAPPVLEDSLRATLSPSPTIPLATVPPTAAIVFAISTLPPAATAVALLPAPTSTERVTVTPMPAFSPPPSPSDSAPLNYLAFALILVGLGAALLARHGRNRP